MNKKSTFVKWRRYLPLYLMLIPGAVYIFINNYIPMAGLIMAFEKYDYKLGMFKSPKIGLDNFTYLFATKDALNITRNTLLYNAIFIILGNILAITVAILLNDVRSKTEEKTISDAVLIPYLISTVIVSYIVYGFLNTQNGFINNSILEPLGKNGIAWYSQPKYWPLIITFVYLWKNFGYSSIIYFATVVGIDKTYYEAAVIDGSYQMAAGQICDTIQSETHNHHAGADVHRTYFLFRLRPVLSGTHEQRSLDRCDQYDRHLCISRTNNTEQRGYVCGSRLLSVHRWIHSGTDRQYDRPQGQP